MPYIHSLRVFLRVIPFFQLFHGFKLDHNQSFWIPIPFRHHMFTTTDKVFSSIFFNRLRYQTSIIFKSLRVNYFYISNQVRRHANFSYLLITSSPTYIHKYFSNQFSAKSQASVLALTSCPPVFVSLKNP